MNGCVYRTAENKCTFFSDNEKGIVSYCDFDSCEEKKPSNADRIRSMSDEEMAEFLWSIGQNPATGNTYLNGEFIFFCGDGNGWLDWLRQEASE